VGHTAAKSRLCCALINRARSISRRSTKANTSLACEEQTLWSLQAGNQGSVIIWPLTASLPNECNRHLYAITAREKHSEFSYIEETGHAEIWHNKGAVNAHCYCTSGTQSKEKNAWCCVRYYTSVYIFKGVKDED